MKVMLRSVVAAAVLAAAVPAYAATCTNGLVSAVNTTSDAEVAATACVGAFDSKNLAQMTQNEISNYAIDALNSQFGFAFALNDGEKVNDGDIPDASGVIYDVTDGWISFNGLYGGPMAIVLKQGTEFAAWGFTAEQIASISGFDKVVFDLKLNDGPAVFSKGGASNDISHAVYFGNGAPFVPDDRPGVVPEAETYAMLLGGLGLIGFMARRRQRSMKVTFA